MKQVLKKYYFCSIQQVNSNIKPAKLAYNLVQANNTENQKNNLLVLHGFMGSQTNFRSIVKNKKIAEHTNSYLIDQRNHGFSEHRPTMTMPEMAFDIKNFIHEQNIQDQNLILMGHSMGGRVVMEFLQNYPELHKNIKGAIIVDILAEDYMELKNPTVMETFVMVNRLNEMKFVNKDLKTIKKELLQICGTQDVASFVQMQIAEKNQDFVDSTKYYWKSNMNAFSNNYQHIISHETEKTDYTGPVYSICGDRSTYANQKLAEKSFGRLFKNFNPQTDLEFFQKASHWVHAEHPTLFIDRVSGLLQKWLK